MEIVISLTLIFLILSLITSYRVYKFITNTITIENSYNEIHGFVKILQKTKTNKELVVNPSILLKIKLRGEDNCISTHYILALDTLKDKIEYNIQYFKKIKHFQSLDLICQYELRLINIKEDVKMLKEKIVKLYLL